MLVHMHGRGARKIAKMKLSTLNGEEYTDEDKRFLQFLVAGHEGDIKRQDKLIKKYKIPEDRVEIAKKTLAVLRDSDALDRARLSNKFNMDLNARYLSTDTAKSLIDFSFGLEGLSKRVNLNKYMESVSTKIDMENKDTVIHHDNKEKNEFFQEIGGLVNDDIELYTKNISDEKEKCRDNMRDDGPGF